MAFWGDYHTHTVHSHGKGTIEDNVVAAINKGLKEIAITDHGFKHLLYNVKRSKWDAIRAEADEVRQKYPQINIYLGLETNLNSGYGNIDIKPSDMDKLDLVVCGYHRFVASMSVPDFFRFHIPNLWSDMWGKSAKKLIVKNTDAYISAIEKFDIDIVSHMNYGAEVDCKEVAKACAHFGTYVELNGKRVNIPDKDIEAIAQTGAEFICDSDAHSADRVGDMSIGQSVIERLSLPYEKIANWERLPLFRSRRKKEKNAEGT